MRPYSQRLAEDLSNFFARQFPIGMTDAAYQASQKARNDASDLFDAAVTRFRQVHPGGGSPEVIIRESDLYRLDPAGAWEALDLFNRAVSSKSASSG
jgi:hypothetical protein